MKSFFDHVTTLMSHAFVCMISFPNRVTNVVLFFLLYVPKITLEANFISTCKSSVAKLVYCIQLGEAVDVNTF